MMIIWYGWNRAMLQPSYRLCCLFGLKNWNECGVININTSLTVITIIDINTSMISIISISRISRKGGGPVMLVLPKELPPDEVGGFQTRRPFL